MRAVSTHRWSRAIFGGFVVCVVIYLGFWTTPIRQIPQQAFDEPDWLYSSFCVKPLPGQQWRAECQALNIQTIDFSPTTKNILALARKVAGIPADRVKYYYHIGEGPHVPLTPEIRAAIIHVIIGMSSLALILLVLVLRGSFGSGPALTALAFLLVTPYWRYALRGVLADPGIFFFSVLAWAGTCWLAYLLVRKPRFLLVFCGAAVVGIAVGCAMAARYNSVLLALGYAAVLLYVGTHFPRRWFLALWAAVVAFLAATAVLVALATPVSWHTSPAEYIQIIFRFNSVIPFGYFQGNPLGPVDSLRTTLAGSFTMSYFNVLPPLVSIPLCLVGLWSTFHRASYLGRISGIWLLAIGLPQLFLNPVGMTPYVWDRYAMYFILAVYVFMGIGVWEVGTYFVRGVWRAPLSHVVSEDDIGAAPPPRDGAVAQIAVVAVCCVGAAILAGIGGITLLQGSRETALWKSFILATTADKRIAVLGEIVARNPQARVIYNGADSLVGGSPVEALAPERAPANAQPLYVPDNVGEPVVAVLGRYFEANVDTIDPAMLGALMRAGPVLIAHSDDPDLRARIRYDMDRLDDAFRLLTQGSIPADDFTSSTPQSLIPTDWKENPREVLADPRYPIEATLLAPQAGSYRIVALGLNPVGARIPVGVTVDGVPVGTIVFDRGDNSWTAGSVVATLSRRSHQVAFQPLSSEVLRPGRMGAIRRVMLRPNDDSHLCRTAGANAEENAAVLCATGSPAVVLDGARSSASIAVDAPVPALYDIALTVRKSDARPQQIRVAIDGLPLGGLETLTSRDTSPYSTPLLPPLSLVAGRHTVTITRVGGGAVSGTATLDELALLPRYPDPHTLTPAAFGSHESGGVPLTGDASAVATMRWYGHNFGFYALQLAGSTDDAADTNITVYADDQPIGTARLTHDGVSPPPIIVELANGATHQIRLQPTNLPVGLSARVYAVEIKPYIGPPILPASSMLWPKRDNGAVTSSGAIISVPAGVPLARTTEVDTSGIYRITARVRLAAQTGGQVTLGMDIDGWHIGDQQLSAGEEWTDISFMAYLPKGGRMLEFRWSGGAAADRLDLIYVTVQAADAPTA